MKNFDGYRANVGIILCNKQGQVLWAKRKGQNSWQFPQGGIDVGEDERAAMYRELYEEIGLQAENVEILSISKNWLKYKLPRKYIRYDSHPTFIGQRQKWFLLRLLADDTTIKLDCNNKPEFDDWRWVSYWYPVRQVISFKRDVYRKALKELIPFCTEIK